jgi:ABC-type Mn2+/Zn2+ transport system permease subunit
MEALLELVTQPFSYAFMRSALWAGLLTVVASSLVGTWVVLRGLAFMGDALAHGVLPGIAVAYLLGVNLLAGAAVSALVMVAGVSIATSRRRIGEDTAIGLLFVGMLALGVAIISARGAYAGDLTTILFGDPIGVQAAALRTLALSAATALAVTVVGYRAFLALTYDRTKAKALGLRPEMAHLVMLALVALVVVASFRAVGTLLVFAFLIAPPATAVLVARRVPLVMVVSMGFGSLAVLLGLLLSFHLGTATSATIAGLSVLGFFLVLAGQSMVAALRTSRVAPVKRASLQG